MTRESSVVETLVELADTLVDDFDVVELLTGLADRCVKLLGVTAGYIAIAVCAFGAVALLWVFLTETKPEKYD